MANLNKVMLIGRLTRDPEMKTFTNGGKVAKFGFAVNNRKKNQQTNQWEDVPVYIDVEAFNRGELGKQADLAEQYLHKGREIFIEGHLRMDSWEQDGQKRSKILVVVDNFQFIGPKPDGMGGGTDGGAGEASSRPASRGGAPGRAAQPSAAKNQYDDGDSSGGGSGDDIPF